MKLCLRHRLAPCHFGPNHFLKQRYPSSQPYSSNRFLKFEGCRRLKMYFAGFKASKQCTAERALEKPVDLFTFSVQSYFPGTETASEYVAESF